MTIVSDTSVLGYLVTRGQVDLLRRRFGALLVPPEVAAECRHPSSPDALAGFVQQHVHPVLAALTMSAKVISIEDGDAIGQIGRANRGRSTLFAPRPRPAPVEQSTTDLRPPSGLGPFRSEPRGAVQDLEILSHNTRCRLEVWQTPDGQ